MPSFSGPRWGLAQPGIQATLVDWLQVHQYSTPPPRAPLSIGGPPAQWEAGAFDAPQSHRIREDIGHFMSPAGISAHTTQTFGLSVTRTVAVRQGAQTSACSASSDTSNMAGFVSEDPMGCHVMQECGDIGPDAKPDLFKGEDLIATRATFAGPALTMAPVQVALDASAGVHEIRERVTASSQPTFSQALAQLDCLRGPRKSGPACTLSAGVAEPIQGDFRLTSHAVGSAVSGANMQDGPPSKRLCRVSSTLLSTPETGRQDANQSAFTSLGQGPPGLELDDDVDELLGR